MSQGGSVQFGQVIYTGRPSPLKSNPRKWIHGLIVKEHHKCVGTVPSVTNPSYILLAVFSEPLSVSLPHLMASSLPRLTGYFPSPTTAFCIYVMALCSHSWLSRYVICEEEVEQGKAHTILRSRRSATFWWRGRVFQAGGSGR
jgi:hypothetical protein